MSSRTSCIRWAVDLSNFHPSYQELALATSCIQAEEKDRLKKFYFRDDFNSSLVGRLLMRKFVRESTGIEYNKIQFNRDHRGKPYLVNVLQNKKIDFNVSHQGSFCVLAGVYEEGATFNDFGVGVDVMKIEYSGGKSLNEFFRLMNRNFSDTEWKFIKGRVNESGQLLAFMRHWCLKESYVKNVGTGITVDLRKISFNVKSEKLEKGRILSDTTLKVDGMFKEDWLFEEHLLDDCHCAAISFKNLKIQPNNFIILSLTNLLEGCVPLLEQDDEYCQNIQSKEFKKS